MYASASTQDAAYARSWKGVAQARETSDDRDEQPICKMKPSSTTAGGGGGMGVGKPAMDGQGKKESRARADRAWIASELSLDGVEVAPAPAKP